MATALRARAWGHSSSLRIHLRLDELRILGVLGFELRGWGVLQVYGAHMQHCLGSAVGPRARSRH